MGNTEERLEIHAPEKTPGKIPKKCRQFSEGFIDGACLLRIVLDAFGGIVEQLDKLFCGN